jgi:hypothetical protein
MDIYTSLKASNIGPMYEESFEKNGVVVLVETIKDDFVQMLTKSETPYHSIAKLSATMGDVDITQTWCANNTPGCNKYENVWNNGKMARSFVYPFNFELDKYDEKVEVEPTDKFDVEPTEFYEY